MMLDKEDLQVLAQLVAEQQKADANASAHTPSNMRTTQKNQKGKDSQPSQNQRVANWLAKWGLSLFWLMGLGFALFKIMQYC